LIYKLLFATHFLLHHWVVQCSKKQSHEDAETTSWNLSHESQQTIMYQYIPKSQTACNVSKAEIILQWHFTVIRLCWHLYHKKFPDPFVLFCKVCSPETYISTRNKDFYWYHCIDLFKPTLQQQSPKHSPTR
jgi:hypothetical protein